MPNNEPIIQEPTMKELCAPLSAKGPIRKRSLTGKLMSSNEARAALDAEILGDIKSRLRHHKFAKRRARKSP